MSLIVGAYTFGDCVLTFRNAMSALLSYAGRVSRTRLKAGHGSILSVQAAVPNAFERRNFVEPVSFWSSMQGSDQCQTDTGMISA